ncbi:MAG: glycoside hydrolase family 127 protein [Clostridia bacterium]|nr:glycoside hydrolase family 127 protein [Clostridia bacterium]
MRQLYAKNSANYPRLSTDTFFADYENLYHYQGFVDSAIRYIENFQLLDTDLWHRFVQQFRADSDFDAGWRGEYWGKMMRGACFTYSYTKNEKLYRILTDTVCELLESEDPNGRISTYDVSHEFDGWDMWNRKYVLLGLQYYMEICRDEALIARITASMCRQVDYIMSKIGPQEEKKIPITTATRHWRGLNSSSILEPVVRLYTLTGEQKYFDFATYIVNCGGTDVANIFELAYENDLLPYQYPVTKAYEMTSCFEGLLEYYRITGIEKYKTAIINYANRILESDFTVIGSSGCSHELFDHSFVRQANTTNNPVKQETCVTVTLMKFFYQLTLLTGDSRYADAFEISLYNAYFGAINTEKKIEDSIPKNHPDWILEPLPFDSYSPLTAGTRGIHIGGSKMMSDHRYYGCCACIGSAGNGLIPKMQLLSSEKGFVFNLFINGTAESTTPLGQHVVFELKTDYPVNGKIEITLRMEHPETFEIKLRNPAWSKTTLIAANGKSVQAVANYTALTQCWRSGDCISIDLDMRTEAIFPTPYGTDILMNKVIWGHNYVVATFDREDPLAKKHIALRRGPIMLAQENRLGYSVDDPIEIKINGDGYVDATLAEASSAPYPCIVEVKVPLTNGTEMMVTDYASAGKLWNEESKTAVWMQIK